MAASPQLPSPVSRRLKASRWREAIVALVVLAGVIALGVLGPDRSKPAATSRSISAAASRP